MTASLDLALVGNGQVGCLFDAVGRLVWGCLPRFDGDPIFCTLLDTPAPGDERGIWAIDLVDLVRSEQDYEVNTAVLVTRLYDRHGGGVEITDCAPRFIQHGRVFHPMTLVRRVRPLGGTPRIVVRLRPIWDYGSTRPETTVGSSHVRYVGPGLTLRLTTDVSLTAIVEERTFLLDRELTLLLGPDETLVGSVAETGRHLVEETRGYWRDWVRHLAIPFEWQRSVIRAAITLQQNAFDDTGAIVAAMTTSIPEAPFSGRNWDYRYCWLRDGYFVVDALNRLNATDTMERYLAYILNVVAGSDEAALQPVYRINGDPALGESLVASLPGYQGMGPVRVGNDAYRQVQHDVYGSAILAATHVFFDERLNRRGDAALFERLEPLGRRATEVFDRPDAGLWELRGRAAVHTFSGVMCWAACDRLARIGDRLGLAARASSLAIGGEQDFPIRIRTLLERPASKLCRIGRRRCAGRKHAASRRVELRRSERSTIRGNRRGDRPQPEKGRICLPLRRPRRLRRPGERLRGLLVLVRERAGRDRTPRRGACAVSAPSRSPEPPRLARRASGHQQRRAVGKLRPDLQHGRSHLVRDPAFDTLGRDGVDRFTVRRTIAGADPSIGGAFVDSGAGDQQPGDEAQMLRKAPWPGRPKRQSAHSASVRLAALHRSQHPRGDNSQDKSFRDTGKKLGNAPQCRCGVSCIEGAIPMREIEQGHPDGWRARGQERPKKARTQIIGRRPCSFDDFSGSVRRWSADARGR